MVATLSSSVETTLIHPSATIDASAKIADDVRIGPGCFIGANVTIGSGTVLDAYAMVKANTIIGNHNHLHSFVAMAGDPQDGLYKGEETWLEIGDHNQFREFCTINRGSTRAEGKTIIGNHGLFLAYSHVAHDCRVDDHVTMVNHATLGGHVVVHRHAIVGAFTAVHQFSHIGEYSFLARGGQANNDILPYMMASGIPAYPRGLNLVGLRRNGFSHIAIRGLKQAFHIIYDKRCQNTQESREQLIELAKECPEVQLLVDAIDRSKRGIARETGAYESLVE